MPEICIAPHEIQEGDLLAYLDDAASSEVTEHIARCPACATEAIELQTVRALMTSALYRDGCPSPDTLLQYQNGLLSRSEQRQVKDHIVTCAECRRELAELSVTVTFLATETGETLIERLKESGRELLQATMLPPSPKFAPTFRGAAQWQRAYQAGTYQIIIGIVPPVATEKTRQIEGQVLPQENVLAAQIEGEVQLIQEGKMSASDTVDELGFFALEDIPLGRYTLELELPEVTVLIEDFSVT